MIFSMRRLRARLTLIQGKVKLGLSFILCTAFLLLLDHFLGLIAIILEKDFESDFSYPLEVDNFPALIENFRNGEAVEYDPVNRLYSRPKFLEKADSSCDNFQLMVILVKSAPSNIKRRNAIRSTWGSPQYLKNISNLIRSKKLVTNSNNNRFSQPKGRHHSLYEPNVYFKLVFLVGLSPPDVEDGSDLHKSVNNKANNIEEKDSNEFAKDKSETRKSVEDDIKNEIIKYRDVVRIETVDTYSNNTWKTMMAIRWATEVCSDFEYALLVDDDMYISIKNLLIFLESPATYPDGEPDEESESIGQIVDANRLFAGKVLFTKPIRQRIGSSSKWYLSLDEYPYNYFPRYMPAAAIVMSKQVVDDFYYASFYTKHFRFDDIFLGIMAYKMGITPFSCSYFHVCHTEDGKCPGLVSKNRAKVLFSGAGDDEYTVNNPAIEVDNSVTQQMEHVIARHGISSPEKLIELWRELNSV